MRNRCLLWLFVLSISPIVRLGAQTPSPQAAATPQQLVGLWVLTSDATIAGKKVETPVHRLRGFTDHEWFYAQSAPANKVDFVFGGTYTATPSGITETAEYASQAAIAIFPYRATLQFKVDGDTLTVTGRHGFTGPVDADSVEVWRHFPLAPERSASDAKFIPSDAETSELLLQQRVLSASPQNLAASYLGNHDRLAMLAQFAKGGLGTNVNLFMGSEKVTPENVDRMRSEFQHREDAYAAEMKRRGTTQIGGAYRASTAAPCSDPPTDVAIKQDGFSIDIRKADAAAEHVLSGAVVRGVLTVGDGDFSADTYAFGKIGADGTIELKAFSGQGCSMTLTKR